MEEEIKREILAVLQKMSKEEQNRINKRFVKTIGSNDYRLNPDDIAEYVAYDNDPLGVEQFKLVLGRWKNK